MDKEELKEVMRLLKEAGIDAQLCDTPVPVSANPARCGWPENLEDGVHFRTVPVFHFPK